MTITLHERLVQTAAFSDSSLRGSGFLPPGVVIPFAGSAAPDGWLLCYGQSLLRASYVDLFAAIGTTFGAADGTHFNLPDMRGRVPAGKDDMGGSAASRLTTGASGVNGASLGASGGAETHALTTAQLAAHNHGVTDPGHTHGHNAAQTYSSGSSGTGGSAIFYLQAAATINSATTGITTQNNGSGTAHNNTQPTIVLNSIIKT